MHKKRSVYDIVVVTIVVVLALVMSAKLYAGRSQIQKSGMLVVELGSFRNAIRAYRLVNKANPSSLEELTKTGIETEVELRPFLEKLPALDEDGRPVDPFGSPYSYDSERGWVSSSTSGYERW
ncbi:MAG TPA: hypothetical protein PLZ86_02625 [bacterium]|nr:hypothetical protein [bacterium]